MSVAARTLAAGVTAYRWLLSPILPPHCRYWPSCSAYALEALREHGALAGSRLTVRRLSRCHPWGGSGVDPVPPRPADRPAVQPGCMMRTNED